MDPRRLGEGGLEEGCVGEEGGARLRQHAQAAPAKLPRQARKEECDVIGERRPVGLRRVRGRRRRRRRWRARR